MPIPSAALRIWRASPLPRTRWQAFRGELNAILAFVEQLGEVNVDGVEPMTSVTPMAMKMREDKVTDGDIAGCDHLRNAPAHEDHFFVVPEGGGITMCLACEQDAIWLAYLESKGLLKPDDPAAVEKLFAGFPGAAVAGAGRLGRADAGSARYGRAKPAAKNPFSCDDPTNG